MRRIPPIEAKSDQRGLAWDKQFGQWRVRLTVNGKRVYLGRFASEADAVAAYDAAVRRFYETDAGQ
jgi:hypothetical protein